MEQRFREISEALIQGRAPRVRELVQASLEAGVEARLILKEGLIGGMQVIGEGFKRDEIFLPEVMIAARAMHAGLEILDPILSQSPFKPQGRVVLGTVRDDLHDIGKNLVSMMFRGAGFEIVDLGISVTEARFVEAVRSHRPDILGLSALLTMTMPMMRSTVEVIDRSGLREDVIVMVGGAPVTGPFAAGIGADGYAPDAASAVDRARELMKARGSLRT